MEDTIRIEDISKIEKKLFINVPPEAVNKSFDTFFEGVKKEAQVPGFRKGRAPVKVLKKYFKRQALGAVSQILISEYYQSAIKEHNLSPVKNPDINNEEGQDYPGTFNDDESYSIEVLVEVMPDIDPVGYKDIKVDPPEHDFDKLFDQEMTEYRTRFAEREQIIDGETQEGDTIIVDLKGFMGQTHLFLGLRGN